MQPGSRSNADRKIGEVLSALAGEFGVDFVLGYLALRDEVRIDAFLARMVETGRDLLLPRTAGGRLSFARWRPGVRLNRDEKGVLAVEAGIGEWVPQGNGLIIVPGRAFDPAGRRLGRGGGYYDRLLDGFARDSRVVGVAYECQVLERIACEDHDRSVEMILTEAGLRRIR